MQEVDISLMEEGEGELDGSEHRMATNNVTLPRHEQHSLFTTSEQRFSSLPHRVRYIPEVVVPAFPASRSPVSRTGDAFPALNTRSRTERERELRERAFVSYRYGGKRTQRWMKRRGERARKRDTFRFFPGKTRRGASEKPCDNSQRTKRTGKNERAQQPWWESRKGC